MKKILYLYAEVMGYTMATIEYLASCNHEIHVIHWDHKKLTPYKIPTTKGVFFYNRSEFTDLQIKDLVSRIKPQVVVVSGWMDKGYLKAVKDLRPTGVPVVVALDGQWVGGLRQMILPILGKFGFFRKIFSHAWVAGVNQFEYARKIGFPKKNIVFDLYSADLKLFQNAYDLGLLQKQSKYPHRFLFVGRLEPIKGLDLLLEAWEIIGSRSKDWQILIIGDGSLKPILNNTRNVILKGFMQPSELMSEVREAGCFLLPSKGEPWGVVVHEFAAAGLPLIVSDVAGATSSFLINGFNGFAFEGMNVNALVDAMLKIINTSDEDLIQMAINSNLLSKRITPETSSANLLSIVG